MSESPHPQPVPDAEFAPDEDDDHFVTKRGPLYGRRVSTTLVAMGVLVAFFFNASAAAGTETDVDRWMHAGVLIVGGLALRWMVGKRELAFSWLLLIGITSQLFDFAGWVAVLYLAGALYTLAGWFLPPVRHQEVHHRPHAADMVCENVEAIAMALVIALSVKEFIAEAFVIPTGSMEPTILGTDRGKRQGDRLLAFKVPLLFGEPPRWSIMVFKYPMYRDTNYIKRLVGLPGELMEIRDGDIYVNGTIQSKPDAVQETLWFPHYPAASWDRDGASAQLIEKSFRSDSQAEWNLSGASAATRALPGKVTRMRLEQMLTERDLRISADVHLTDLQDDAAVLLEVKGGKRRVELAVDRESAWLTAPGIERTQIEALSLAKLGPQFRIGLGVADRVARVYVNGRLIAKVPHADESNDPANNGGVSIGFRGTAAQLTDVRVDHDIHYQTSGQTTFEIPDDSYVMLGDNTTGSLDSRKWEGILIKLNDGTEYRAPRSRRTPDDREVPNYNDRDPDFLVFHDVDCVPHKIPKSAVAGTPQQGVSMPFVNRRDLLGRAFFTFFPFPPFGDFRPGFHP